MSELDLKIIQLICELKTNKQIADELKISVPSLNLKIRNVFKKIGVTTRYELIYKVKTDGLK